MNRSYRSRFLHAFILLGMSLAALAAPPGDVATPAAPPAGALPPLVVSTDPAYDQYVSRLYVMSTVLPNGRICYVAYGSKGVPPGTDGAAWPNYLTFYYSDDKGATLHIGFSLVLPPVPKSSVLAGTLDGVLIHEVPTHPRSP